MKPIRVAIVDDHPMVRRGLRNLLAAHPDIEVVGDFEDGATTLRLAPALEPDVVLIDVKMPGMDGFTLAHRFHQSAPGAKIIHLSAYEDDEYVQRAFGAGAFAYLLKSAQDDAVVDTVRRVYSGERLLSPSLATKVLERFQTLSQADARRQAGLEDQDVQILVLLAEGATNEDIAKSTCWSDRTVKRRIEEICNTLGTRNRAQAVAEAMKRGLI